MRRNLPPTSRPGDTVNFPARGLLQNVRFSERLSSRFSKSSASMPAGIGSFAVALDDIAADGKAGFRPLQIDSIAFRECLFFSPARLRCRPHPSRPGETFVPFEGAVDLSRDRGFPARPFLSSFMAVPSLMAVAPFRISSEV